MSQVKSSSHSPHCIEHSPYPPCVPTCRLQIELEQFLAAGMAKPIRPPRKGDRIGTTDGTCIQQQFGPLPKEPFQPLGHGPNIISLDSIKPDPLYEGLFIEPGTAPGEPIRLGLAPTDYLAVNDERGELFASFDPSGRLVGGALRDTLNGTGPRFERNPYLSTNPNVCVNHEMAWHWKAVPCEVFEEAMDHSVGFFDDTDEAIMEARRFRIGRDAEVQKIANDRRAAVRQAKDWRSKFFIMTGGAVGLWLIQVGNALGWW